MRIRDLRLGDVLQRIRSETGPRRLRRLGYCCEVRYQLANTAEPRDGNAARLWWEAAAEAYRRAA